MEDTNIEIISIDLSNYCSKECSFCYNHSRKEGNTLWKTSEVVDFATDCIRNGIKAVSLGGGEPFEYDGIFDIIDALYPMAYLSVTSNGLPLEDNDVWQLLCRHKPDKIHLTIHQPDDDEEVARIIRRVKEITNIGIKAGVNLLVDSGKLVSCRNVYEELRGFLSAEQIILVPRRFCNTPSPKQLASVANNKPFQSPSCLLGCRRPANFASVSWDKRVNSCSFAGGKTGLQSLDYRGLIEALSKVEFISCDNRNERLGTKRQPL